jgi:hypothetical protein
MVSQLVLDVPVISQSPTNPEKGEREKTAFEEPKVAHTMSLRAPNAAKSPAECEMPCFFFSEMFWVSLSSHLPCVANPFEPFLSDSD